MGTWHRQVIQVIQVYMTRSPERYQATPLLTPTILKIKKLLMLIRKSK